MDKERQKRNRTIRLIITEVIMTLSVIGIVAVLMMTVMGYSVKTGEEWSLEQSGLVQIVSTPAAAIDLDGERLMQRTEISRMMNEGEHEITLSRDGYDSWTKKITVRPGYFLRLKYPRLFKADRETEKAYELGEEVAWSSFSADRTTILYAKPGETVWRWVNLKEEKLVETEIETAEVFSGSVKEVKWAQNGEKILARTETEEKTEWVLVNLKDVARSVNLSKEFDLEFSKILAMNDAADKLWVLENGNVREINVGNKEISSVLVANVADMANRKNELVFVTREDEKGVRTVGAYEEGATESVSVKEIKDKEAKVFAATEEYLGDTYLSYSINGKFYALSSEDFPAEAKTELKEAATAELSFTPAEFSASANGQFVVMKNGEKVAVFDAETEQVYEFTTGNGAAFFLDDFLIATVENGQLIARDFDGTNRRALVDEGAAGAGLILSTDRYLYYFSAGNVLMRQAL